jgi:hypothetical protein
MKRELLALLPGVGALFAPKCPACLVAYLSFVGLGVGSAATIAPMIRPLGIALTIICLFAIVRRRYRRARLSRG